MKRSPEIHIVEWHGITIEIRYEPEWLGLVGDMRTTHFDITAIKPERASLPITETGYRSHFANPEEIETLGGPVPFVLAWLSHEAQSKSWRESQDAVRQMSLF